MACSVSTTTSLRTPFYFAVEAKAILAVRPELRFLDPASLGELIALEAVLENRSLFRGISVMPAASLWRFRNGGHRTPRAPISARESGRASRPSIRIRTTVSYAKSSLKTCRGISPASQRVAMSLTGGLDTRAVMAWYKGPKDSLPCCTFGGALS